MRLASAHVTPERVEVRLEFDPGEPLRTSGVPSLTPRMAEVLPGLRSHRCDNQAGAAFADELADTEIAHLVEHAALELMAMSGSPDTLRGHTWWDFAATGPGVFNISLEYDDDLVCLGAVTAAVALVEELAADMDAPDMEAQIRLLRDLRGR